MSKVIVTIDVKNGNVEFDVNGIIGTKCKDITELLTQSQEVISETNKEEQFISNDLPDYVENMG